MKSTSPDVHTFRLRTDTSAYVIFSVLLTIPVIIDLLALQKDREAWKLLILTSVPLMLILLWLHSFELSLSADTVCYKTLFGGQRSLKISDIESASIRVNFERQGSGLVKLVLQPLAELNKPPLYINLKPFRAHELSEFFAVLNSKLIALGRPEIQRPGRKVDRFFQIPKPTGTDSAP